MGRRGVVLGPVRVRIMTREGEAFVTSVWQAGDFYVTPCVGPAKSARLVEFIDQRWTRFEPCSVTHGPSGCSVTLVEYEGEEAARREIRVTSMTFALARLFAAELAARPGVVVATADAPGFAMVRELIEEASAAALMAQANKSRASVTPKAVGNGS